MPWTTGRGRSFRHREEERLGTSTAAKPPWPVVAVYGTNGGTGAVTMARNYSNRSWSDGKRAVRSFGENRLCEVPGCDTKLSRYNPDPCCFAHRDRIPPQPIGRWVRA